MFLVYKLIDLLPPTFEPQFAPRLSRLYWFLKENPALGEGQACIKHLGSIAQKSYFNKMKNQLQSQLGHCLLASPTSPDDNRTAYQDCYKDFSTYKMLLMQGMRTAAIEIAQRLIPRLKKMEIHSLWHLVAQDLLFHYSNIDPDVPLMKKYRKMADKQLAIVQAESMIRNHLSRVGYLCNTRDSFTPAMVTEIKAAAAQVEPLLRLDSNHLNRLIYNIIVARYAVLYDNENIIKYCEEALASFPESYPNSRSSRFLFMHNKTLALAALGKLEEAKELAKETSQITLVGSFNWHLAFIKRIIICFHTGAYQEAYELYKAHKQQKKPHKAANEYWKIIQGYLHFLINAEKIEPYHKERFSLAKFLNDMPVHSRDKAGQNISILIIQILIQMQRDQFGQVIDRIDSLREYARTYTRNPETKRANLFINMIIKMESAHFHRSRTESKTQKLLEKLDATPIKFGQNLAIEAIPYSVLWQEILTMLKDRPRATTIRKTSVS